MDADTAALAREIKAILQQHFGGALDAVYVFGSRARGGHRLDSDLDIAVALHHVAQSLSTVDRELLDLTYPIEIDRGLHIQAWAIPVTSISEAGGPPGLRARLATIVRREGVRL